MAVFRMLFPVGDNLAVEVTEYYDAEIIKQLRSVIECFTDNEDMIVMKFFEKLPSVRKKLLRDAEFLNESDPASTGLVEVVAIYPGFFATYCYRIAHILLQLNLPLLPRMITELAHKNTGIDIHPGAVIGCPIAIDHGTGIVIGETTYIGNKVKIYQGVTLGALSVSKDKASKKRHPTIEDNVILYAGCTILGGETTIGRNSVIGGGVWLTESISPYSVAYHKTEVVVRDLSKLSDTVNFVI